MHQEFLGFRHEIVADLFAGGGGASQGIRQALGRCPDIAVNHSPSAILMHETNHPSTAHYCEDVFAVNPKEVTDGQPVGLAWFSPDCKHFSKAKGGQPVSKHIRGLAWDMVRWGRTARPRIMILENVEEFQDWGPLVKVGAEWMPDKAKKSWTFKRWVGCLKAAGYVVEWRELRACDYGAPTIRKRLFVIARRDGMPIVWPKPTHGKTRGLKPFRTAAECIDFTRPCHSIFLTKADVKRQKLRVKRPLSEATQRRIATGTMRFVVNNPNPFLVNTRNGERPGQDPRCRSVNEPYWTPTAQGSQGALITPIITKFHTGTSKADTAMVAAFLAQHNTDMVGHMPNKPMSTIVGKGCTQAPVLVKLKGTAKHGQPVTEPLHTVQAEGTHFALSDAQLVDESQLSPEDIANGHRVYAFLIKYYTSGDGKTGCSVRKPMPTVRTKDGLGLVLVHVGGGKYGVIVDICMRMLDADELFLAQGFPRDYKIDRMVNGRRLTATEKVRLCGNSVCPPIAEALVRANFKHESFYEALAA